ncbi:MAG: exopolysaccharide biosynthesis polyprenyl glycosylphosphotransferase [Cardiobacteriaceae bacterium]|nr:exopolysaccharide biosynthesis polyprenyl glycosylphosphotransferase [Cardiobacteriaceae bacterium]
MREIIKITVKFLELFACFFASWLVYYLYFQENIIYSFYYEYLTLAVVFLAFIIKPYDKYKYKYTFLFINIILQSILKYSIIFIIVLTALFILHISDRYSRIWLFCSFLLMTIFCTLIQLLAQYFNYKISLSKKFQIPVIIIGENKNIRALYRKVIRDELSEFKVRAIRSFEKVEIFAQCEDVKTLDYAELKNLLLENKKAEIWITTSIEKIVKVKNIIYHLSYAPTNIKYFPDYQGLVLINRNYGEMFDLPYFGLSIEPLSLTEKIIKRSADIFLSLLFILIASPVLVLSMIWIYCVSGKPIIYKQKRVSLNGEKFSIYKLRTMPTNNEKAGAEFGNAANKDVIFGGRFIRRWSIDELPQLFNVVRGDMSLVGPRPEREEFVEIFKEKIPQYMQKHLVKAGITGWAQVQGYRGDTDLNLRIKEDIWYIEHYSLWLDIKILFLTVIHLLVYAITNRRNKV